MQDTITNKGNQVQSFVGEKAVDVFRIKSLISALKLLQHGIKPCRGFTLTYGLSLAKEYTGNSYKRSEVEKAKEDLNKIMQLRLNHINIITE